MSNASPVRICRLAGLGEDGGESGPVSRSGCWGMLGWVREEMIGRAGAGNETTPGDYPRSTTSCQSITFTGTDEPLANRLAPRYEAWVPMEG